MPLARDTLRIIKTNFSSVYNTFFGAAGYEP